MSLDCGNRANAKQAFGVYNELFLTTPEAGNRPAAVDATAVKAIVASVSQNALNRSNFIFYLPLV